MKMNLRYFLIAIVLPMATTLGIGIGQSAIAAIELIPHRAVYGMTLHSAQRGSGISGARGNMIYGFSNGCEGWSSETNVKLQLLYAEGDQVSTEWAFASWEAKDGKSYQFRTRQARNGTTIENLKGLVKRSAPNAAAEAKFSEPEGEVIKLPKNTLFPTRHLIALLESGAQGRKFFSSKVFDGASLENPYEINAVQVKRSPFTEAKKADATEKLISDSGLAAETSKHYRLAFFAMRSKTGEPQFELGVDYRSDGIARFIRQDFGDFVIDLVLEKIEVLDKPSC
jgi:hypothetical protein